MKLSIKKIESSKPLDKPYKLTDGGGLYLYITPQGLRSWRLKYRFNGKEKTLTFGKYPSVSLSEAREKRDQAKKLLANGLDPQSERKRSDLLIDSEQKRTFSAIAKEWHSSKIKSWSKNYANATMTIFEQDIFPYFGNEIISKIKPLEILTTLKLIEQRGAIETAKKARMRCAEVFQYAIITGRAEHNPARELASAMINRTSKNYPFLTEIEMREFLKSLNGYTGNMIIRYATNLLILTALRTIELRTLKWTDIDFNEKFINVREEVIKKDRKHIVPLSSQAIAILQFLKPITGHSEYVFMGRINNKKPISDGAILQLIKRLGFANRASGHGFRHQFSTVLNEQGFNRDWIEKQLNHETGSIRGIYNHAQYLDQRKQMMQWYADYIDGLLS